MDAEQIVAELARKYSNVVLKIQSDCEDVRTVVSRYIRKTPGFNWELCLAPLEADVVIKDNEIISSRAFLDSIRSEEKAKENSLRLPLKPVKSTRLSRTTSPFVSLPSNDDNDDTEKEESDA